MCTLEGCKGRNTWGLRVHLPGAYIPAGLRLQVDPRQKGVERTVPAPGGARYKQHMCTDGGGQRVQLPRPPELPESEDGRPPLPENHMCTRGDLSYRFLFSQNLARTRGLSTKGVEV